VKLNRALLIFGLLLTSVTVGAQQESAIKGAQNMRLTGAEDPATTKVYIVQLRTPSAAEHHAALTKSYAAASKISGAPRPRFDKDSADIQAYVARLEDEQQRVLSKAGSDAHG